MGAEFGTEIDLHRFEMFFVDGVLSQRTVTRYVRKLTKEEILQRYEISSYSYRGTTSVKYTADSDRCWVVRHRSRSWLEIDSKYEDEWKETAPLSTAQDDAHDDMASQGFTRYCKHETATIITVTEAAIDKIFDTPAVKERWFKTSSPNADEPFQPPYWVLRPMDVLAKFGDGDIQLIPSWSELFTPVVTQ